MKKNESNPALLEAFITIIGNAKKICIPSFNAGNRFVLVKYEQFWDVYSYSKSSYWNIGGNHYHYLHDSVTGEFKASVNSIKDHRPIESSRLLKKDVEKLCKLSYEKHAAFKAQSDPDEGDEFIPKKHDR